MKGNKPKNIGNSKKRQKTGENPPQSSQQYIFPAKNDKKKPMGHQEKKSGKGAKRERTKKTSFQENDK